MRLDLNLANLREGKKSYETSRPGDTETGGRARQLEETGPDSRSGLKGWFHKVMTGILGESEKQAAMDERESSRLPVSIPVTLCGLDRDGQAFRENTRTVIVSKRGAKIVTLHDLEKNAYIWIENVGAKKFSIAKVVGKGKRVDPKEATEICAKVLDLPDPEKIWGIEAPPEDWTRDFEQPSEADRLEYHLARGRLARPEILAYGAVETTVPEEIIERNAIDPAGLLELDISSTETKAEPGQQSASSIGSLAPPHTEAGAVPLTVSDQATESPATVPQSSGSSGIREVWGSAPIPEGSHHEQQIQAAAESGHDVQEDAEAAEDSIASRTEPIKNGLTEISTEKEGFERRSAVLLGEFERKLEAALVTFQQKSAAQAEDMERSVRDLVERGSRQVEEQIQNASREIDAVKNSIHLAGEQARAQLQAVSEEMESRQAKRMAELSSAEEGLEQKAGKLVKRFEGSLDDALRAFQEKGGAGQADLERAVQGLLESSKHQLQEHINATVEGLGEKAKETLATAAEEARKQVARMQEVPESLARTAGERLDQRLALKLKEHADIAGRISESATNSINLFADQAVKRLEAAEKMTEDGFSAWADFFESRLAELLAGMEGFERQSETLLQDFQDKLESTLGKFLRRKTAGTSDLQEVSNDLVEDLTERANEQTDAATEKLNEEARAVARLVEEESQTHLAKANEALESAARAATEMYAQRLARTSAEHEEQAWLGVDEVNASLNRTSQDAVARLKAAQEQTEARFTAHTEAHEKRMAEISSRFEDLKKRSLDPRP